jgi:branched-chain amino acid transport system ATP-binding protein
MALLEIRDLSIAFDGVQALSAVTFSVEKGQLFSIVGPNGAGKTTVFNCISRICRQDGGDIRFAGRDISRLKCHEVPEAGIARTFQNLELFSGLTTLENILVGCDAKADGSFWGSLFNTRGARRVEHEARQRAERVIEFLELEAVRKTPVVVLPYGMRKRVEIGRALALEPDLLLLDEPAAGLNAEEMEELAFWIQEIRETTGMTFLLVEHDMHFVMDLSDRVAVLDHGQVILEGRPHEVQTDSRVIEAYLGSGGQLHAAGS